jgi:hypothetical protein
VDAPAAHRPEDTALYRVGGLSAVGIGVSYIAITALYVISGPLPADVTSRLRHFADHTTAWWTILALSIGTDLLFLPVMCSLYRLLKHINTSAVLAGTALVGLFIVLDLAVTWPNFSVLITLGDEFVAASDENQRTVLLAAATYAVEVLSSGSFGVYVILLPAAGIFIIGLVMLKSGLGKVAAYLGIATGVLGVIAVVGPIVVDAARTAAIFTSILTTLWVLVVGYQLLRIAARRAVDRHQPR